jgi:hypothetical protein
MKKKAPVLQTLFVTGRTSGTLAADRNDKTNSPEAAHFIPSILSHIFLSGIHFSETSTPPLNSFHTNLDSLFPKPDPWLLLLRA